MRSKKVIKRRIRKMMKKNSFKTPMVDYTKTVLSKVSFDLLLFEKELSKALKNLLPTEITELKNWCYNNYPEDLYPVFNKTF